MIFALIKNGVVENVIVADAAFVEHIAADWDLIVNVTEWGELQPGVGWTFDGLDFHAPVVEEP